MKPHNVEKFETGFLKLMQLRPDLRARGALLHTGEDDHGRGRYELAWHGKIYILGYTFKEAAAELQRL